MSSQLVELSNALASATEQAAATVVAVHSEPRGSASGVVWRPGVIVTSEHALRRDEEIRVTLADGRVAQATLVGRDPSTDLAVLKCADATNAIAAGKHRRSRHAQARQPDSRRRPHARQRTRRRIRRRQPRRKRTQNMDWRFALSLRSPRRFDSTDRRRRRSHRCRRKNLRHHHAALRPLRFDADSRRNREQRRRYAARKRPHPARISRRRPSARALARSSPPNAQARRSHRRHRARNRARQPSQQSRPHDRRHHRFARRRQSQPPRRHPLANLHGSAIGKPFAIGFVRGGALQTAEITVAERPHGGEQ